MALAMRMVRNVEEQRRKRKDAPPQSPHSASEGLFRYPGTAVDQFGASAARATFSPERGPTSRGMFFSAPGPKAHRMLSEGVWHVVPGTWPAGVWRGLSGARLDGVQCSVFTPRAWPKGVYVFLRRMARRRVIDSPMRVAESAWQKAHDMLSLARDSKACDTVEAPWCAARKRVVGSPRRVAQRCVICLLRRVYRRRAARSPRPRGPKACGMFPQGRGRGPKLRAMSSLPSAWPVSVW